MLEHIFWCRPLQILGLIMHILRPVPPPTGRSFHVYNNRVSDITCTAEIDQKSMLSDSHPWNTRWNIPLMQPEGCISNTSIILFFWGGGGGGWWANQSDSFIPSFLSFPEVDQRTCLLERDNKEIIPMCRFGMRHHNKVRKVPYKPSVPHLRHTWGHPTNKGNFHKVQIW